MLSHKAKLRLDEGEVEDLLDLRVSVEKDVNRIEAEIKTASSQIYSAIQIDGLANAEIEDHLQQIGEFQAEIENLKVKGLAKVMKELSQVQRQTLNELLLREME